MALTFSPTRLCPNPVATIQGDFRPVPVYISENAADGQPRINVDLDERCMVAPTRDPDQRDVCWVWGATGCGKSRWCKLFIEAYVRTWGRKRPVVIISQLDEDPSLPSGPSIRRLNVNTLKSKPLDLSEMDGLEGALFCFDDVDAFPDKELDRAVQAAQDLCLSQGRHRHISMLVTSHVASNYSKTRLALNTATHFVCYSHGCAASQMQRLLCAYGGLDAAQVKRMRKLPSRWVCLKRTYPPLIVSEHAIELAHAE